MSALLANLIDRSHRDSEDWRYTNLDKLLGTKADQKAGDFEGKQTPRPPSVPPASGREAFVQLIEGLVPGPQRIVFVDGVWRQDMTRLTDVPPAILHGDVANGYCIDLAAQSCLVTAPIELVFAGESAIDTTVKLKIDVGPNSSLTIIEHHVAWCSIAAQVIDTEIHLGTQAKLVHKKIMHTLDTTAHFARVNAHVAGGAYYRHFILAKDTRLMRSEIDVTLAGPLAQCGLYGAMLLRGSEHVDIVTRVNHATPHNTSRQLFKAIVKDRARGVFQGRIKVAEGAQKADGQQLCRALLLSDQAEMDAKPELEIYADDVSCSHGCAVGELDAEAMFYLRSRGLNESEARALLLRAFIDEVIDTIQVDEAHAYMRNLTERWMNE